MFAKKTLIICGAFFICTFWQSVLHLTHGQTKIVVRSNKSSKSDLSPETKQKAIKFLSAVGREAQQLGSAINRVRAQALVARVLWEYDEAFARALAQNALSELQHLFREIQTASLNEDQSGNSYTKRANFSELRNYYILTLAARDAKFAITALQSLKIAPSGEDFDPLGNDRIELQIASIIAKKDPQQALGLARQQLKTGINDNLIETLKDLSKNNFELAAKLAQEIFATIKKAKVDFSIESNQNLLKDASGKSKNDQSVVLPPDNANQKVDFYLAVAFLNATAELNDQAERDSEKKQTPALSSNQMRELADIITQAYLNNADAKPFLIASAMPEITRYSPASAESIRRQLKAGQRTEEFEAISNASLSDRERSSKTPDELASQAERAASPEERDSNLSDAVRAALATDNAEKAAEISDRIKNKKAYDYLFAEIKRELPLAKARQGNLAAIKKLLATIESDEEKAKALAVLITALAEKNQKDAALKMLDEAKAFLPVHLKRKTNLDATLEIAFAASLVDAPTAFSILENTAQPINDLIAAGVLINDFYDYGAVAEDELLFETIERQSLTHCSNPIALIQNLAASDYERTVNLANKFARPEIRLFIRFKIAEALLDPEAVDREKLLRKQNQIDHNAD